MRYKTKDLIIVGAGPAGLMAAKTAAELGLSVVVIEKNKDFTKLRRACSAQFILDDGYEGEWLQVTKNRLIFKKNKFGVAYTGKLVPINNKYYHSPRNHIIHFAHADGTAFALKFDKRKLLADLYDFCQMLGVEFRMGTLAIGGIDDGERVSIELKYDNEKEIIQGNKLIIAEGANANLCEMMGLNEGRKHFATAHVVKYLLEGVKGVEPHSWNLYYGRAYHSNAAVIIGPSLYGEHIVEMTLTGDANLKPTDIYEGVVASSPLSPQFQEVEVVSKQGCSVKAFSSLKTPYKGNVIVIGDAAAFVEVEVQGALMCGYRAAHSIMDELKGRHGFKEYTRWWEEACEFNREEYLSVSQGYALVPTYTDNELDYLFGLIEKERLEGTYSQYKTPKLIWEAILTHKRQIMLEAPEVYAKIQRMNQIDLSHAISK